MEELSISEYEEDRDGDHQVLVQGLSSLHLYCASLA
jgi:hypothetical protein